MGIIFAPIGSVRIVRGTAWADDVQLVDKKTGEPVDLTGITGLTSRIRDDINGPILLSMSLDAGEANLVVVDASEGRIGFRATSVGTLSLPDNNNEKIKYIFDVVIERSAGEYEPAVTGKLSVLPSITRPWGAT